MITRSLLSMSLLLAACAATAASSAADLPARKAGLWEITTTPADSKTPPMVQKVCLDKSTDELLYKFAAGASAKLCSKVDIHSAAGQVVVDSQCAFGGTQAATHSVMTLKGDTAYHTDSRAHYDPALFGRTDSSSTQDGRWTGPCPSEMRPGDVTVGPDARMPVPMKMNLNDMFKGAG